MTIKHNELIEGCETHYGSVIFLFRNTDFPNTNKSFYLLQKPLSLWSTSASFFSHFFLSVPAIDGLQLAATTLVSVPSNLWKTLTVFTHAHLSIYSPSHESKKCCKKKRKNMEEGYVLSCDVCPLLGHWDEQCVNTLRRTVSLLCDSPRSDMIRQTEGKSLTADVKGQSCEVEGLFYLPGTKKHWFDYPWR